VTHVAYGDLDAVKAAIGPDVAAVIVERCRARVASSSRRKGSSPVFEKLCDENGSLLFVDEVQTGVGRLGAFSVMTDGRARGCDSRSRRGSRAAVPIGAMLTTEALANALPPGTHGSTFGGNPLACTASLAVLKILDDEKLIAGAHEKGKALHAMLEALAVEASAGVRVGARRRAFARHRAQAGARRA